MKRVTPDPGWPQSWRHSYLYDLEEVYGQLSNFGYAYAYQNRRDHTLALINEVLSPGARILDIAAAQGNFSIALAEQGYEVTWNDLRADLEGYVAAKHEFGSIRYAPGNAFELQFEHLFDAVLITEVIEHVAHPDEFLRNASSLVRPGGYIVMTTPNGAYFRNGLPRFSDCPNPSQFEAVQFGPDGDDHIFLLHADEIKKCAADAGLRIERLFHFTNSLTNGHIKLECLLKVLPRSAVNRIEVLSQRLPAILSSRLMVHTAVRFSTMNASTHLVGSDWDRAVLRSGS